MPLLLRAEPPLPQVQRLRSSPVLRHLVVNPADAPSHVAAQTVTNMYLPEGFRLDLIAAEPEIHQPVAFAWDERGRIWVVEANSYPAKRPVGEGLDQIVIFGDEDGDGRFESRKIFAEGLNLVSGLEVGYGGVWVGAAPELLFIPDRNRDDVPDGPPQVLLEGFGYQDTHETMNSFLWGPDGWLYGIQGVFNVARIGKPGSPVDRRPELRAGVWRFHPVRHEFEVFAHGGSNPWGLDHDEHGQLFMTHCRSYWGRGPTTHVIQGGQFWNQVNGNYAPFIIARPPAEYPWLRNYLLASARYGHGAGGAGPRGSDAIYGGHSHVGTMIYYGDNWPDEYRGHLFTHNLGGHQINQQINNPVGSGFDTVHAGRDMLFCTELSYVAVDLQYGPDGAVYIIDWTDPQHCHNPNIERWDRSNGRIYRLAYTSGYRPVKVDLGGKTDLELVRLLSHKNAWYGRTARRLLHERTVSGAGLNASAVSELRALARQATPASLRLKALWTLAVTGNFTDADASVALGDENEYVRGWAIQLSAEDREVSAGLLNDFRRMAQNDPSPVVRRYLASAVQRVDPAAAWTIINALAQHGEDREDRNLPLLLWHGLAPLMVPSSDAPGATGGNLDRAFDIAKRTRLPQLREWVYWYAATLEGEGLNRVVGLLSEVEGEVLRERLAGLWLAMEPRANLPMPMAWKQVAPALYSSSDERVRRQAERLAAVFGDESLFPRLREILADREAGTGARQHAFAVLSRARDRGALDLFLNLLDEDGFRSRSINLLARFDSEVISEALIERFDSFSEGDRAAALTALTSRSSYARALLDAIADGKVQRDQLTSFHVRRLTGLNDEVVNRRVAAVWGRILQTPGEKMEQIDRLEKVFQEAPLWAYSAAAGHEHYVKICSQCHRVGDEGVRLGPELTGAGKHGVRYFLENIIDPDAVIGTDFQMTEVETRDGEVVSGLVVADTAGALTIRTTVGESIVAKAEIAERKTSEKSLMPEGLLEALPPREQIELLKFLVGN